MPITVLNGYAAFFTGCLPNQEFDLATCPNDSTSWDWHGLQPNITHNFKPHHPSSSGRLYRMEKAGKETSGDDQETNLNDRARQGYTKLVWTI